MNETLPMRIIIAILVIGAIGLVALDRPEKSITCLIVLLIYYVRYIWTVNKVYSLYKEGTFPMLTFEGPQNTMSVEEGKGMSGWSRQPGKKWTVSAFTTIAWS